MSPALIMLPSSESANQPQNFYGAPGRGSFYDYQQNQPIHRPSPAEPEHVASPEPESAAFLSVDKQSRLLITRALVRQLNLGAKSRFRIVPPRNNGGTWFFDTNPRHEEGFTLGSVAGRALFRLPPLPQVLFQKLVSDAHGKQGSQGKQAALRVGTIEKESILRFRIGAEVAPGYYQLERVESGPVNGS